MALSPTVAQANDKLASVESRLQIQATEISAGLVHSCALFADGAVACWGGNASGQLGNGGFDVATVMSPVIGLPTPATAIAAGAYHTCAILTDGVVWCWGSNLYGELGDGSNNARPTPRAVVGLPDKAKTISAGSNVTCAILADDGAYCWGANGRGQLGINSSTHQKIPSKVQQLDKAKTLHIGSEHACAVLMNNSVACWGANSGGQLGNGNTNDILQAQPVAGLSDVVDITTGLFHTCVLLANSQAKCWGLNSVGQLGNNSSNNSLIPTEVDIMSGNFKRIVSRRNHTCVVGSTALCWGENTNGQLGDGTWQNRSTPVAQYSNGKDVLVITTGGFHTCVINNATANNVTCWGENTLGQLGNDISTRAHVPHYLAATGSNPNFISAGSAHSCISAANTVNCWGSNLYGQLGNNTTTNSIAPANAITFDSAIVQLKASAGFSCVVTAKGAAQCWGSNLYGELGNDTPANALIPTLVKGLDRNVVAIATGSSHACAMTQLDGAAPSELYCWGNNQYKQLGDDPRPFSRTPVAITAGPAKPNSLSAGNDHICLVTEAGAAQCWGHNNTGQLGDSSQTDRALPQNVSGLATNISAVAAGGQHTCALKNDGAVLCWGNNEFGQLGNGNTNSSSTPQPVGLGAAALSISAGKSHTCAILAAGELRCWGLNSSGQLGNGQPSNSTSPVKVIGLTANVIAVSAGAAHTCALVSGGRSLCWGDNTLGQLGIARPSRQNTAGGVLSVPLPRLSLNYTSGNTGSVVTLGGAGFAPNAKIALSLNNISVAQSPTASSTGDFVVFLDTTNLNVGNYIILANTPNQANASATLKIDSATPKRNIEGGGDIFLVSNINSKVYFSYLPLLR